MHFQLTIIYTLVLVCTGAVGATWLGLPNFIFGGVICLYAMENWILHTDLETNKKLNDAHLMQVASDLLKSNRDLVVQNTKLKREMLHMEFGRLRAPSYKKTTPPTTNEKFIHEHAQRASQRGSD
jgi:hypothetical protein